jgi:hypothetical protein
MAALTCHRPRCASWCEQQQPRRTCDRSHGRTTTGSTAQSALGRGSGTAAVALPSTRSASYCAISSCSRDELRFASGTDRIVAYVRNEAAAVIAQLVTSAAATWLLICDEMTMPTHVPMSDVQMYWLVAFAVMSAMFSPCANEMLNAARVEPPAIIDTPFSVFAIDAISRK